MAYALDALMPIVGHRNSGSFGALSSVSKDHLYHAERDGLIYTSPWVVMPAPVRRHAAIFSLSANHDSFPVTVAGDTTRCQAAALRSMTEHVVNAAGVPTVGFVLEPSHPHFSKFRGIADPGLMLLERDAFTAYDEQLMSAYHGTLSIEEACDLFHNVIATVLPLLPKTKLPDPRVATVIDLLWKNHDYPLEDLAAAVGLSYHRLSHLFADDTGIPLRSYQLWRKVRKAISLLSSGRTLIEIAHMAGLSDSAHLTRAFQQTHAAPPSFFMNSDKVRIHSLKRSPEPNTSRTKSAHVRNGQN